MAGNLTGRAQRTNQATSIPRAWSELLRVLGGELYVLWTQAPSHGAPQPLPVNQQRIVIWGRARVTVLPSGHGMLCIQCRCHCQPMSRAAQQAALACYGGSEPGRQSPKPGSRMSPSTHVAGTRSCLWCIQTHARALVLTFSMIHLASLG